MKQIYDLCIEDYKTELKETKELHKQWFIPCLLPGRLNTVKTESSN